MRKTLRKVVCFKRASDGALEPAWATPSYYTSEGLERRLTAQCNISLGRLRRHLARTGQRWEVEQDRERKAKKAKAEAELAARNAKRAAAEALFDALERLLLAVEHDKVPGIGFATDPARAALALAKTIPAKR